MSTNELKLLEKNKIFPPNSYKEVTNPTEPTKTHKTTLFVEDVDPPD